MIASRDPVFVDLETILHQRKDDSADPCNLLHRRDVDAVILARVHLAADRLLHSIDGRGFGSHFALNVLTDPDVPVDTQNHVNLAASIGRLHRPHLPLGPDDAATAARTTDTRKDTIPQLPILETARVQARAAILLQLLHLGDDQVPLGEEAPNLQLVDLGALAQDAAGQVDGRDGEDGELGGGDVDAPALGLDLGDAADDEVADLGVVARAEGAHREELVCAREGAGEGGCDGCGVGEDVCAVAAVEESLN